MKSPALPRPPGIRFAVGAIPAAIQLLRDPRVLIDRYASRYGRVWKIKIPASGGGFRDLVWMLGPEGNERILAPQHRQDFSWYEGYSTVMEPIFGRDILLLRDDTPEKQAHRDRHRMLIPAFHPRLDGEYIPAMRRIVGKRLSRWPGDGEIDLAEETKRIAFEIIASLLMGTVAEELDEVYQLNEELGLGLYSVFHLNLPGFRFRRGLLARKKLAQRVQSKIDSYRRDGLPDNMLGQLMRAGVTDDSGALVDPVPDETLVAEMIEFVYAGYDTGASMLTSFWVAIAQRPDVFARIVEEAGALAAWTWPAMQEQRWLDAALVETERMYPPLLFLMRGSQNDFEFGGFQIRRGDNVAYSPYYTGRMPSLFPEPGSFRPERFVDGQKVSPYTMVGFGAGPRACIGKRFANIEMRVIINEVLRHFELRFIEGQADEAWFNPTLQRRNGYRVRVKRLG